MELTKRQIDAVKILGHTNIEKGMSAAEFALQMWPDSNMHLKRSNGGNGVQKGKAGWLCGGSYLAKLAKLGIVAHGTLRYRNEYYLTSKGREIINKY